MSEDTLGDQLDVSWDSIKEEHIQEYSNRVAEILEISSPQFSVKFGTKKGDNYMGIIYRVLIEGEKDGLPVKISTILKVPPEDEIRRSIGCVRNFFLRENIFYLKIVPLFNELLLTRNKILKSIPKCYFSSGDDHKEAIYLEDLQPLGYVTRDRVKRMDFAHMSLVFQALGRFHALSFAMRDQRPEVFAREVASLEEPLFVQKFINRPVYIGRSKRLINIVKTALNKEDSKYMERYTEFAEDFLDHNGRFCSGILAEPYAVLTHGDLWTNNIMFKYDEDSEEPRDLYFLDFQLARYASPATDISYTLYTSCGQELREKHFDELIKIYYESLTNYLRELGSDPEKLFPYDALLNQLKKFSTAAAVMVTLVLSGFTCQNDDVHSDVTKFHDLSNCKLKERIHRDDFWSKTLRDSIKDLIDRDYI